ncbi:helix-turn-helix domain-containing protein [Methylosinus sp. KRF6]|uniref:helix-turn-helix domain-containing protein n=1 Tax=Methylosinus sp. KRF6 TaxID=2846853 RepID=UPI001C0BE787|nr:helix-turn-helix domain-containing protein [Methylosinus sp. KRF6]MBU3889410.1 helix-turn-helix domain-containing protein [Methylosinus sp. KRF6]
MSSFGMRIDLADSMSEHYTPFLNVTPGPSLLADDDPLRPFLNHKSLTAWPAVGTLARLAGLSVRTVQRLLRAMKSAGHLSIEDNAARFGCNLFGARLLPETEAALAKPAADRREVELHPAEPRPAEFVPQSASRNRKRRSLARSAAPRRLDVQSRRADQPHPRHAAIFPALRPARAVLESAHRPARPRTAFRARMDCGRAGARKGLAGSERKTDRRSFGRGLCFKRRFLRSLGGEGGI